MAEQQEQPNQKNRKADIEYVPYRGPKQPVSNVKSAKIFLYPKHLEAIVFYDYHYKKVVEGIEQDPQILELVRIHAVIPKAQICLLRTIATHKSDDEEITHLIELTENLAIWASEEEITPIFKKLKSWVLQ